MNHPSKLNKGDKIGICAPSSGIPESLCFRLDNAEANLKKLGYFIVETEHVRGVEKCVSASSKTRAKEFMQLYRDESVKAIIPPWGGEFLMDMLEYLDFDEIKKLPPKWIMGYSDITTLLFPLTLICDMTTIHGSNILNMGFEEIHEMDLKAFEVMSSDKSVQKSSKKTGGYAQNFESYNLDKDTEWKSLYGKENIEFSGRIIGGCLDVICKLIGTKYAPVESFLERYKEDGFIWTLESCEMASPDIYRTLWQMRECGWFRYCNGILIGRPDGYSDKRDFNLVDSLKNSFDTLDVPVIYDTDIGHIPPQMQIINGSYATVTYFNGKGTIKQILKK